VWEGVRSTKVKDVMVLRSEMSFPVKDRSLATDRDRSS
jgi:hypothetical protein